MTAWPATSNGTVPIGHVYPTLDWLPLGPDGPVDDEGELVVRGSQRFRGYLDDKDNAGRFVRTIDAQVTVPDAATNVMPAGDWYRTGDRVRRVGDLLVHLGRIDRQVKVKGHRIELGDVEAAVRRHPAVADAAVITIPDGHGGLELLCGLVR